jgi:hypothetical protein
MKDRWLSEVQAICRDARSVLDGLAVEQANQAPRPGRWSVAQNLLHTSETAKPYLGLIAAGLASPHPTDVSRGILAGFLVRTMEPPPRLRVKTLRSLEPSSGPLDPAAVIADFEETHTRFADMIRGAPDEAFRRARFRSPFMSVIRLRLDQGVDVMLAHARRHLWQARQARRDVGLPS